MSPLKQKHVCVIGAGLGGLTAACTLAARGFRVTLVDKNDWLGGKAAVLEEGGFRFDMGPTILTLPSVLRRVFAEAGHALEERVPMLRLDPQWRCFYEGGSVLDLHEKPEAMRGALEKFTGDPKSGDRYGDFIDYAKKLHGISERFYFWKSVGGIRDTLDVRGAMSASVLQDLRNLRMGHSVGGTVRSYTKDARVAQMLDHFTQYVGSAPDASPAVLCGIAHMQVDEGIWYPLGGTRAVPVALAKLAAELGVEILTKTHISRILVRGGSVSGVETSSGKTIACDAVVSNCDAVRTYDELLGKEKRSGFRSRKYRPACSGVVLYLGLRKRYEHLLHHNFVFSEDPHEEFRCIYQDGQPAPDPTCYVCAPSLSEPGVAPDGGEALYVLTHTPYLRQWHDWKRMFPAYRKVILDKLKRAAGMEDIEERIVVERALTPEDIHERYHVLDGAIYGLASHGRVLGAFKPANRSPHVKGLYLAGGAAHPGPGMPMVMMSGWIAADSLDADSREGVATRALARA